MTNYKLVPVKLLKDWRKRINTIAVSTAFNVADEMGAMLEAAPPAPDMPGLTEALRQYQHNDGSGLVFGYDKLLVDRYVARLVEALELIAESCDAGRHDGLPEEGPAHCATESWLIAKDALASHRKGGEV